MIIYKVLLKDYGLQQGELLGAMAERRKDLRGKSKLESGLKWARLVFGQMARDKQAIFVVPQEFPYASGESGNQRGELFKNDQGAGSRVPPRLCHSTTRAG
jgi:hypothetical protein